MVTRGVGRFALALPGLCLLLVPLAMFLPADPVTTLSMRALFTLVAGIPVAVSYARGVRSLKRLGLYVLVVQVLSMTLVPGVVLGYAALSALRTLPGGGAAFALAARTVSAVRPVGTFALVASRYLLAYYVVYRGRWLSLRSVVPFRPRA